jgi:pyruvate dehydrogenase E2 component (dihydrolipoamide acetyltransferase)
MGDLVEVRVPDIGDFDAVDVVEVLVTSGDQVAEDDSLITLESDKATMDVPSPFAGTVRELKVKAGDKVHEGSVILTLDVEKEEREPAADSAAATPTDQEPAPVSDMRLEKGEKAPPTSELEAPSERPELEELPPPTEASAPPERHALEVVQADFSKVYASPAVRRFARELGVDLTAVRGTGRKGRIIKDDVEGFVKKALAEPDRVAPSRLAVPEIPVIDFSKFGEVERQPLTRIQKIAGPNLQRSWVTAPHVTQHDEADITDLEAFRQENKGRAKEQGFNLTPVAFVMKAVVKALEEFPRVNSSLAPDGEHLMVKKYYHLGIAVDTEDGLIVPVIRDVDKKGTLELAAELAEVSSQARERKLKPDQLRGASFTISSLGGIGGSFFTPIINTPEVAILGLSRHYWKPVWKEGEFVPRLILPISLSYDHRVIDGALAVRFTTYLCNLLADLRRLLL